MEFKIKGKVHEVSDVINVSDTFRKRELILIYAENPAYPEYVKFEAFQDRINLFDNLTPGSFIEVSFNLRGRPWVDKTGKTTYFTSLQAWKVNIVSPDSEYGSATTNESSGNQNAMGDENDDDDLPF